MSEKLSLIKSYMYTQDRSSVFYTLVRESHSNSTIKQRRYS